MPTPEGVTDSFTMLMHALANPRRPARAKAIKAAIAKAGPGSFFKRFLLSRLDALSDGGAAMLLQMAVANSTLRPVGLAWLDQAEKQPIWLKEAGPAQDSTGPILWRTPSTWQPKMRLRLTGHGSVLAGNGKEVLEIGLEEGEIRNRWRLSEPVNQFAASPDRESLVVVAGKTMHRLSWRGKEKDGISVNGPEKDLTNVIHLSFDESGEHIISACEYLSVAFRRTRDLSVITKTAVYATAAATHLLGSRVLTYGDGDLHDKIVLVDVAKGTIQAAFGDSVQGMSPVEGGRLVSCEVVSGQYVLRLRRLETTEVVDELVLGWPVVTGQSIYRRLTLEGASSCGRYAAVQVYSAKSSNECETLLVDWHTRSIYPLGPRTLADGKSVFTSEHFYVHHRRGLARFNFAGQLTALLPFPGYLIDLVIERDRGVALVGRGGVIGNFEIVGLDLTSASMEIPSTPTSDPARSLASFPDGSLRGLKGKAELATIDPLTGETIAEIPLGGTYSNTLTPLSGGRVLLDEPARIVQLSDLSVQAIEGGEGCQYEMVSVDRDGRLALGTFDESDEAQLIDLSQPRVIADLGVDEKNARITAGALAPDGSFAVLGSDHGRITRVSTDAAQAKRPLGKLSGPITAIVCARGGCLAAGEKSLMFVPPEGEPRKVAHHAGESPRIAIFTDESHAVLAGDAGRIEVWSLPDLVCTAWTLLGTAATSIAVHGTRIVAVDSAGGFHSFELKGS